MGSPQQPGAGSRNRLVIMVAAGVVGVVLLGAVLWFATGGFSTRSAAEAAARDFFDAAGSGDCERIWSLIGDAPAGLSNEVSDRACEALENDLAGVHRDGVEVRLEETEVVRETSSGAVVDLTLVAGDEQRTTRLRLRQVNEEWKVDYFGLLENG